MQFSDATSAYTGEPSEVSSATVVWEASFSLFSAVVIRDGSLWLDKDLTNTA
jgi:hypothetical protein